VSKEVATWADVITRQTLALHTGCRGTGCNARAACSAALKQPQCAARGAPHCAADPRQARAAASAMLASAAAFLGRGSPASSPKAEQAAEAAAPGADVDANDAFELLEILGKGSYGSVYKGRARASGELFAIKVIPLAEGVRLRAAPAKGAKAGTGALAARPGLR
jgi:hypothetical protein